MESQGNAVWRRFVPGGAIALLVVLMLSDAALGLPDGRTWEQVSPTTKNAADVIPDPSLVRVAEDGSAVQYSALTYFGDVRGGGAATDYLALRDSFGEWRTHGIVPQQEPFQPPEIVLSGILPRYVGELSADLSEGVFLAKSPVTDAPNVANVYNLYLRTNLRSPGPGAYRLLTDAATLQPPPSVADFFFAAGRVPFIADASANFSHVLFESSRLLTLDAAGLDPDLPKLYEWVDGSVRLIGYLPESEGGGPTIAQAGQGAMNKAYTTGTLSRDGSRVVFTVPSSPADRGGALYLRDDQRTPETIDDTTVRINASQRTDCNGDPSCGGNDVPDPTPDPFGPQAATYWASSVDGSKIFFTTSEQLTDDDINHSNDLYRYDVGAPVDSRLTRLSVDDEPDDNGGDLANGHDVSGVIGVSVEGDYVYFTVTQGQLVQGGPQGQTGGPIGQERIFVSHNGTLHEVGAVNGFNELGRIIGSSWGGVTSKWARVTPDGTHLAFMTQGTDELLSLYGHTAYTHGDICGSLSLSGSTCVQIYLYDATAGNGNGDLQCASCDPTGAEGTSEASFYDTGTNTPGLGASSATYHLNHPLSDDGRYVFFNSDARLQPEDHNDATDAYEYDSLTHQMHLLSGGTGTDKSMFLDASPNGHDVLFVTREQLRSTDHDQSRDLYDARIDGAPDLAEATPNVCTEDACRPAASSHKVTHTPASASFKGSGDRVEPGNPPAILAIEPLTSRQRRNLTRLGHAKLTLEASASGTVTVQVRARIGGRGRTIQTVERTLTRGGTLHLRIRLNDAARRHLARTHRLRLTFRAAYSQSTRIRTMRVVLTTN